MIRFKSLSSGSCGNCYFLGSFTEEGRCEHSVIIDTGVSLRRAKKDLQSDNIAIEEIDAILVTHDHNDHIRSLGSWCKRLKKPVWATERLHNALTCNYMVHPWISDCRRKLSEDGWTEIVPGRISVRWFEVPHDATQTVGYAINMDGYMFVIMTDAGSVTDEALELAGKARTLVIEANYDYEMLIHGPYPKVLQDRICGGHGHLSNDECAEAIGKVMHDGLDNIFLCHLSEHNNTPELAVKTCRKTSGTSRLVALPRQTPSRITNL